MTTNTEIPFRKMNGLGNDFVIFDARQQRLALNEAAVCAIAARDSGIGCDQLIVMAPSDVADTRMRIWNQSGQEVESCGNAARCVADLLFTETGRDHCTIDTKGGFLNCQSAGQHHVSVDMGVPRFGWQDIPLAEEFYDTRAIELQIGPIDAPVMHSPSVVNVGNPHCVFWVDNVEALALDKFGPLLENHPIFPERANISIAQVVCEDHILVRVWERGAGLTKACGTGACAVAVCAMRKQLCARQVTITLPGGDLQIAWRDSDDHIIMTGPVSYEFEGTLPLELSRELANAEA